MSQQPEPDRNRGPALWWTQPLQQYFHGPIGEQQEIMEIDGCCTTMVLLVVWMCLRFGCRDPHRMVKSIRCAMVKKRRSAFFPAGTIRNAREITEFLLRLRAWQNGITNRRLNADEIKRWLKIYAVPGSVVCNYMQYDDKRDPTKFIGLCQKPCENGFTWCVEHAAAFRLGKEETDTGSTDVKVLHVPAALRKHCVLFAGYFERRWKDNDGFRCALDTLSSQLQAVPDVVKRTAPNTDTLGTVRFYGFLGPNGLYLSDLYPILQEMQRRLHSVNAHHANVFSVELLLPRRESILPSDRFLFCKIVSQTLPLLYWPVSVVYVKKAVGLLIIDMNHVANHVVLMELLSRYLPLDWNVPRHDDNHRECFDTEYPRDHGIDSVVPLVVFRVHTLAHLHSMNTTLMNVNDLSLQIRLHVQFCPGEWDPDPVAESVMDLIYNYEFDDAKVFWTPMWVDYGDFREHLHGCKLYLTVSDSRVLSSGTVITNRKRKLDATDETGWKIYAEGFVADAILKYDTTLERNTVDVKSMDALVHRDQFETI